MSFVFGLGKKLHVLAKRKKSCFQLIVDEKFKFPMKYCQNDGNV